MKRFVRSVVGLLSVLTAVATSDASLMTYMDMGYQSGRPLNGFQFVEINASSMPSVSSLSQFETLVADSTFSATMYYSSQPSSYPAAASSGPLSLTSGAENVPHWDEVWNGENHRFFFFNYTVLSDNGLTVETLGEGYSLLVTPAVWEITLRQEHVYNPLTGKWLISIWINDGFDDYVYTYDPDAYFK